MSPATHPTIVPTLLFEDTHLLVVDKPAGLLSQGEKTGDENLVDWLRQYLGRPYVGLVHRLDRNTSGALVVAKRTKAAQRLTEGLRAGSLQREYLAWLEGELRVPARWHHWLRKNEKDNVTKVARGPGPGAKEAALSVEPLERATLAGGVITLAMFKLETGRSHQIRAQSSHEGHPLLGDRKYGSRLPFGRPALHSHRIRFEHPMSHEAMEFVAPLPADMAGLRG